MQVINIDASILDANGNVVAPQINLVEGEAFTITLSNLDGYLVSVANFLGVPPLPGSTSVVSGSGHISHVPELSEATPEDYNLRALDNNWDIVELSAPNEGIYQSLSFHQFDYTSKSFTVQGFVSDDHYLGSHFVDPFFLATDVTIGSQFAQSGFRVELDIVVTDNDVWGSQALEDAKNARFAQLNDMENLLSEMVGELGDLYDDLDDVNGEIDSATLDVLLNFSGLFLTTAAAFTASGPALAVFTAAGVGTAVLSLVNSQDVKSATLTGVAIADANLTVQAEFSTLTAAQQGFVTGFQRLALLGNVLNSAKSLYDHAGEVVARDFLKNEIQQTDLARSELLSKLTDLQLGFGKFAIFYGEGVSSGAHVPSDFGASGSANVNTGTDAANYHAGQDAADEISARGGDDYVTALDGNDTVDAGDGNDTCFGDGGMTSCAVIKGMTN